MSQQCNPSKQTTISSFFSPCKGPLAFSMPSFKSCPKQKKKRRRSKKLKKEANDGDDVIIIEEDEVKMEANEKQLNSDAEEPLNSSGPLSPQIIFNGSLILDDAITSTQVYVDATNDLRESPSKRARTGFNQNENCSRLLNVSAKKCIFKREHMNYTQSSSQTTNIAITKSFFEVKDKDKLSKTQKMNSCGDTALHTLSQTDTENFEQWYVASLKTIIAIDTEHLEFDLKGGNDEMYGANSMKYHLAKVKTIVKNSIRPNYENLLFKHEKNLLISFCSLKATYQFICCKLFTHKIKWYNPESFVEKLRGLALTADVLRVDEMVRILEENGFVTTDYKTENLSYLLSLLKADDIKNVCKDLRIKGKMRDKQQYADAILTHISKQPTLNPLKPMDNVVKSMVRNKLGSMFKITENFYNTFYKIHLMYSFTNPELEIPQGLYKFMGEISFDNSLMPKYQISDNAIFETAEEFAAFYKAYSYKEELLQEAGKKNSNKEIMLKICEEIFEEFKIITMSRNIEQQTKTGFLNRFTPGSKYASALSFGIDKLSATYPAKAKLWLEELLKQNYFHIRKRSLLYAHLAIIYKKHHKDNHAACETLANGLKDSTLLLSDVCDLIYRSKSYLKREDNKDHFQDVFHLFQKAPDIKNFPAISIYGHSNSEGPLYKHINSVGDTEYLRVEDYAIRHYMEFKEFQQGIHCEGALMNTLFHILLWDLIYMEGIAQTFVNPIQRIPLDFYHKDFYENRKKDIDNRLISIKSEWSMEKLIDYITEIWVEASNCKAVILNLELEQIIHIVTVLGRKIIAAICEKFAKQYDECHAGLPDLFLWNDTKCKFVEVKGPGDHLSTKQKLWIQFLLEIGADVEVCLVRRMGGRQ